MYSVFKIFFDLDLGLMAVSLIYLLLPYFITYNYCPMILSSLKNVIILLNIKIYQKPVVWPIFLSVKIHTRIKSYFVWFFILFFLPSPLTEDVRHFRNKDNFVLVQHLVINPVKVMFILHSKEEKNWMSGLSRQLTFISPLNICSYHLRCLFVSLCFFVRWNWRKVQETFMLSSEIAESSMRQLRLPAELQKALCENCAFQ